MIAAMAVIFFRRPRAGGDPVSLVVSCRKQKSLDSRLCGNDGACLEISQ